MAKAQGALQRFKPPSASNIIDAAKNKLDGTKDMRLQRLLQYRPLPALLEWWGSKTKTNAICGSNQSGKTMTGLVKAVMNYTGIVPYSLRGVSRT
jgi:hypothetical protein